MKKKFAILLSVSILISIILGISGTFPLLHKFNVELINKIVSLF